MGIEGGGALNAQIVKVTVHLHLVSVLGMHHTWTTSFVLQVNYFDFHPAFFHSHQNR
jgi:hypothetical protein